jgi:hypothetical protein
MRPKPKKGFACLLQQIVAEADLLFLRLSFDSRMLVAELAGFLARD